MIIGFAVRYVIEGGKEAGGVREYCVEENIWT